MTADQWDAKGKVAFVPTEGFPQGILQVKSGSAVLRKVTLSDGTIEFDMNIDPNAADDPSIRFRRRDEATAEQFYLRPSPNCPPSNDCVQYAPVTHGLLLWDLYPQYQAPAPVRETGWNHVKLVISGARMNVYLNGEAAPSLRVGSLQGDARSGAIELRGDAAFANLIVTPDAVEGLSPVATGDPQDRDPGMIRRWRVSPPAILPSNRELRLSDMPADAAPWKNVAAERGGLVNLSRQYGSPVPLPGSAVAWLKATIGSDRAQEKAVSIAWAREVWVFVDAKLVFSGKNLYYPPADRRPPDGRLSLQNGSFRLPLQKGENHIAIAVSNNFPQGKNHYGWGLEFQLHDLSGVRLASSAASHSRHD